MNIFIDAAYEPEYRTKMLKDMETFIVTSKEKKKVKKSKTLKASCVNPNLSILGTIIDPVLEVSIMNKSLAELVIAWWESFRPVAFTEEQHLANPTVNVNGKDACALSIKAAKLIRDYNSIL